MEDLTMLQLENVGFAYPGSQTTYSFDLEAQRDETVAIMGKSGSGKSTLFDLIAGFLHPNAGTIAWDGTPFQNHPPEARPLTILFQRNNLFEHLTAAANVGLGINPNGRLSADEAHQVTSALQAVGLQGHENQRADRLSGGQQQRVALARCIVRGRPLLLLDEPFTGLDGETQAQMQILINEIATRENLCVLIITHDADDAAAIAERTFFLRDGALHNTP